MNGENRIIMPCCFHSPFKLITVYFLNGYLDVTRYEYSILGYYRRTVLQVDSMIDEVQFRPEL